jgi:hypothetical protein
MIEVYSKNKLVESFLTIQAAVDAAKSGNTIKIGAGTYNEAVTVDKALKFEGDPGGGTIMDGNGAPGSGLHLVGDLGSKNKVEISGITFQNYSVAGVEYDDDAILKELKIKDSQFLDNGFNGLRIGGDYDPIAMEYKQVEGLDKVEIKDSTFANNGSGTGSGDLLFFQYYGDAKIEDVTITGGGTGDNAIQFRGDDGKMGKVEFKDVTIDGAYAKTGIAVYNYSDAGKLKFKDAEVTADTGWGLPFNADGVGGKIDIHKLDTTGAPGVAALQGDDGKNKLKGGDGADVFFGRGGNDKIDGGKGYDVAIYTGSVDDYDISSHGKGGKHQHVKDLRSESPDGKDHLKNIEALRFTNGTNDKSDDEILDLKLGTVTRFDQDVTNNVIFGDGNDNGSFTTSQGNGVELGLRAKLRFDEFNKPQNEFNSNHDGSYTFENNIAPSGFSWYPGSPTTPEWNFEFSINSDFDDDGGNLFDFTYLLEIDGDPTADTDFGTGGFDPIHVPFADHAIGDNSTGNGAGATAASAVDYDTLINTNSLAQNSWNYEFFNEPGGLTQLTNFDPVDEGVYTIRLSAFDDGDLVNVVSIDVDVIM